MIRLGLVSAIAILLTIATLVNAADEAKDKDYKDVPLADIGVSPVKPKKEAKTGFIIGAKNATDLVRKLTEINDRTIADLEKDMRPGAPSEVGSRAGFLGQDESLLDVLAMDNEFVVDKLGLTHQDIARPLLIAAAIGHSKRFDEESTKFRYHGQNYRVKMICYKGFQDSPFYDKTATSCDAVLENLTNGKKLKFSPLVPFMVERYGFYEGKGTSYRVEPADVLEMFPYLKGMAKKPG